jgi:sRNA-binding protein
MISALRGGRRASYPPSLCPLHLRVQRRFSSQGCERGCVLMKRGKRRHNRRQEKAIAHAVWARFPECFNCDDGLRIPLALSIRDELKAAAPDLTERQIKIALGRYTHNSRQYLAVCRVGEARINLRGEIVGEVSIKEAQYAGTRLAEEGHFEEAAAIARSIPQLTEAAQ